MFKSFKDICLDMTEEEYRKLPYYSYSTMAKYKREGPKSLLNPITESTPSLAFGSLVDCLITNKENFDKIYLVENFKCTDKVRNIIDTLIQRSDKDVSTMTELGQFGAYVIADVARECGYGASNWKPNTVYERIAEEGEQYFLIKKNNPNKTLINIDLYNEALSLCNVIVNGRWTKEIFDKRFNFFNFQEHPGIVDIEFLYQCKLTSMIRNEDTNTTIKGMIDLIVVDHVSKKIQIYDIKTTSSTLFNFPESFKKWNYDIQQDVYFWLVKKECENDEYFKDFEVCEPVFIVASRPDCKVQLFMDFFVEEDHRKKISGGFPFMELVKEMDYLVTNKEFEYSFDTFYFNGIHKIINYYINN